METQADGVIFNDEFHCLMFRHCASSRSAQANDSFTLLNVQLVKAFSFVLSLKFEFIKIIMDLPYIDYLAAEST